MKPEIKTALKTALAGYAWPGAYPTFLITEDGGALCPACVKKELRLIIDAARRNDKTGGWKPAAAEINFKDPNLICDNCYKRIPSAYGDDDTLAEPSTPATTGQKGAPAQ